VSRRAGSRAQCHAQAQRGWQGERAAADAALLRCARALLDGPSVAAGQPARGIRLLTRVSPRRAGLLFPHAEFASWLAYGNGARPLPGLPLRPRRLCSHTGHVRGLLQAGLTARPARAADSKHPQADAGFFQRREFCFTMDGDIFIRYQSFKARGERGPALRASSERCCRRALLLSRGGARARRLSCAALLPACLSLGCNTCVRRGPGCFFYPCTAPSRLVRPASSSTGKRDRRRSCLHAVPQVAGSARRRQL
jgi:hypothetical protein